MMKISYRIASCTDATIIASLVIALTDEICQLTNAQHFDIDLATTAERCYELLRNNQYAAVIGFDHEKPVALATISETYALYASGKIGVIQECFVDPTYRSANIGSELIAQVKAYGKKQLWSCIELCTPPLPEFERTLAFYQKNGLAPVGGRKMRQSL